MNKKFTLNNLKKNEIRALIDALSVSALVSITDNKGDIIFVNSKFIEVSKYSEEELLGQNHRILKSGKQPQKMFDDLWATISSGKIWTGDIINKAKDGSYYWVDTSIAPVIGEDGNVDKYIAVRYLINDKKELEDISKRFYLATNSAKIGIWEWDVVNNILKWDDQMYELYGIKKEDFSGAYDAWQSGLYQEDKQAGDEAIKKALNGDEDFDITFRVLWPNNEIHWIRAFANVIRNSSGDVTKMVGVNWDITQEKNRVGEIEKLNNFMIDRELKMIELKQEIKKLKEKK